MAAPLASLHSSIVPQGFHFTSSTRISVQRDWSDASANCSLHLMQLLPPDVYADRYELAQRAGYSFELRGSDDLEKPVNAVDSEPGVLLLDVALPEDAALEAFELAVDVPLHARYGAPVSASQAGYHTIHIPQPVGFWACETVGGPHPLPHPLQSYISPERFGSLSISVIPLASLDAPLDVTIPVGKLDDLAFVDIGTTVVMLLMFAYLVYVSFRTAHRLYPRGTKSD